MPGRDSHAVISVVVQELGYVYDSRAGPTTAGSKVRARSNPIGAFKWVQLTADVR